MQRFSVVVTLVCILFSFFTIYTKLKNKDVRIRCHDRGLHELPN